MEEIEIIAEKVAEAIMPHYMDNTQKKEIKSSLVEFAQAIIKAGIKASKEDYATKYWP